MKEFLRRTAFYSIYKKLKANVASILYGNPSNGMFILGVTGTDGKTTTVNLIHRILSDNLGITALVSTTNIRIGEEDIFNSTKMTSLDPFQLQKIISSAKEKGCKYMIIEVSSHGLDQYRFHGIDFNLGVLTNITSEHLDYHKTIDNYANTKKRLFTSIIKNPKSGKYAVLPKDNVYGRTWFEELFFEGSIDYGINIASSLRAEDIVESVDGTSFTIKYLGQPYPVKTHLVGKYNVYNILAAVGTGIMMKIPIEKIIASVQSFQGLPGRMDYVFKNGTHFYIDFAHTPNGLESVLKFLREVKGKGKIITVFGATGERDRYKRPKMGEIVDRLSDYVIVTDDDPGDENRYDIIKEIISGIKRTEGDRFWIMPEREFAIKMALEIAKPGDIVLMAGKGHEQVQITNAGKIKWNDKENLLKYIEEKEKEA